MHLDSHTIRCLNLNLLRAEFGTLQELAKRSNISLTYLVSIGNKKRKMGASVARRLEKATNKPVNWVDTTREQEWRCELNGVYEPIKPIARSNGRRLADPQNDELTVLLNLRGAPNALREKVLRLLDVVI